MEGVSPNHLPLEIVEKILIDVPTYCISVNKPWVCKMWTKIIFNPNFWIRKLMKNKIKLLEKTQSVLQEFESKIQVACLYHACLYEEHVSLKMSLNNIKLNKPPPVGALGYTWQISDNFEEMLMCSGVLITRSVTHAELFLNEEHLPVLPVLLKLLAAQKSTVTVYDNFSFWNVSPRCEYKHLLKGQAASVCSFRGCVTSLSGLITDDVHELQLSIAVDENNVAIDPGISTTGYVIGMLHIKAGTDVSKLNKVGIHGLVLIVTGLESTHMLWMTRTVKKLCLYSCELILLSYHLNNIESKELLRYLSKENIEPRNIMCASSTLNKDDVKELNEFAAEIWPAVNGWGGVWFDLFESDDELMEHRIFDEILCEHE